jgi:hypothetical protein
VGGSGSSAFGTGTGVHSSAGEGPMQLWHSHSDPAQRFRLELYGKRNTLGSTMEGHDDMMRGLGQQTANMSHHFAQLAHLD